MSFTTGSLRKDEAESSLFSSLSGMKCVHKTVEMVTDKNNLQALEPQLEPHIEEQDFFFIRDFTEEAYDWVTESGIQNGFLLVQALHTTCVVGLNELDEPCLLGDINIAVRKAYPKTEKYFHNSSMRTKNLCEEDSKCDRNADAHLKSFLFGSPTQMVIVRNGKPLFGQWQRLCLIDFDGPRKRQVAIQVMGS